MKYIINYLLRCVSLSNSEWNRSTSNGQWYWWAENYQMISLLINNYVYVYVLSLLLFLALFILYIIPKTVDIHTMLTRCFSVPLFRKRKQFRRFVGRPTKLFHQVQNHNCLISFLMLIIQMPCKMCHTALICFIVFVTLLWEAV